MNLVEVFLIALHDPRFQRINEFTQRTTMPSAFSGIADNHSHPKAFLSDYWNINNAITRRRSSQIAETLIGYHKVTLQR